MANVIAITMRRMTCLYTPVQCLTMQTSQVKQCWRCLPIYKCVCICLYRLYVLYMLVLNCSIMRAWLGKSNRVGVVYITVSLYYVNIRIASRSIAITILLICKSGIIPISFYITYKIVSNVTVNIILHFINIDEICQITHYTFGSFIASKM